MKILASFLAAAAVFSATPAIAAAPIAGKWITPEKDAEVTIQKCGATWCGKLSRYLVAPEGGMDQRDVNNPDASKRTRKLLGTPLLSSFRMDDDVWRGRIYDPRNGKDYRSILRRKDPNTLEVKGCLGPFCQTQIWTRAR